MSTENLREAAQLSQRDQDNADRAAFDAQHRTLVSVVACARDEAGRVTQFRGMREPTTDDVAAWLAVNAPASPE